MGGQCGGPGGDPGGRGESEGDEGGGEEGRGKGGRFTKEALSAKTISWLACIARVMCSELALAPDWPACVGLSLHGHQACLRARQLDCAEYKPRCSALQYDGIH